LAQGSAALRKVLAEALDPDTFAIAESRPPSGFTRKCLLVNQTEEEVKPSEWLQVLPAPSPRSRAVVVIDRTANSGEAVQAVAEANFSFGGKSAYAPQVVMVNEFIADTFLSGLVSKVIRDPAGTGYDAKVNGHAGQLRQDRKVPKDMPQNEQLKIVVSGSNGTILEALDG
jgi:hypothetical protein